MLFALDDAVWNTIINGAYGLIGLCFGTYLNYKLNSIQKRQIQNSAKIDVAAEKADVAAQKASVAAELTVASVDKMAEVQRSTNGIKDELVQEVRKAALAEGIAQGRAEARTRSTDLDPNKLPIKEH